MTPTINKKIQLAMCEPARVDLVDASKLLGIPSHRVYTMAYAGTFPSYDRGNHTNGITVIEVQQVRVALGNTTEDNEMVFPDERTK